MSSVEKHGKGVASPAGGLRSLRLGSQAVWELAELVNWANRSDYQPKVITPWVALEETDGSSQISVSPSAHPVAATANASPPSMLSAGEEEAVLDEALDRDGPTDHDIEVLDAQLMQEEAEDEAVVETVQETAQEIDSEQKTAVGSFTASTEDAADDSHAEHTDHAVEVVARGTNTHAESDRRDPAVVSDGAADDDVKKDLSAAARSTEKPAREQRQVSRSTGIGSGNNAMAIPTTIRPASVNSVGDDYLHRLESLVLELNWQLAQQTAETPASEDGYVQWLSRRVIALSVENMQLQEELRNAKG